MTEALPTPISSLYVHVPFCAQKCGYCAFYSAPAAGDLVNRYVAALALDLESVARDLKPSTIFFGGGTPSLLNLGQWELILRAMDRLGLMGAAEWTVECNPATLSLDKARLLRAAGVNRVSLGVQSLDPALLKRLGRVHSRGMALKSFDLLRRAGFDNINLDLMFAIPGQTLEQWRLTLREAVALGSEHLSSYEVIYEEDTALYAQLQAGQFAVDEDLACAMYEELVDSAARAGLEQYEVANFARRERPPGGQAQAAMALPGAVSPNAAARACVMQRDTLPEFRCRHNVNYWRGGSFYGLGPSATSYVRGLRTKNWSNTQLYCEQVERRQRPVESRDLLPPLGRAGETAAFGLRLVAGWPFDAFLETTGHDLRCEWADDMKCLEAKGWGRICPDRFHLTTQGLRFADSAAQMFLR